MNIIKCDRNYSKQILEIFNEAILHSTALYDYKPRSLENMRSWFDGKIKKNFPVIGIVDENNILLGFGSYGTFRERPAYKYTVEHSLYIHKNYRGRGYGKIILNEIIKNARSQEYRCLVGGIDSSNLQSIQLHKSMGFEFCGRIKQAAYKFSSWLDLDFYQFILDTPIHPTED